MHQRAGSEDNMARLGFDSAKWIEQPEGKRLFDNSSNTIASANADAEQLVRLSIALVRNDRFAEGTLAKAYADKILLAIAETCRELTYRPHCYMTS